VLVAAYQREASEAPYGKVWRLFEKGVTPHVRSRAAR
jgi:hypothetical protein